MITSNGTYLMMDYQSVVTSSKGLTSSDPACIAVVDNCKIITINISTFVLFNTVFYRQIEDYIPARSYRSATHVRLGNRIFYIDSFT